MFPYKFSIPEDIVAQIAVKLYKDPSYTEQFGFSGSQHFSVVVLCDSYEDRDFIKRYLMKCVEAQKGVASHNEANRIVNAACHFIVEEHDLIGLRYFHIFKTYDFENKNHGAVPSFDKEQSP